MRAAKLDEALEILVGLWGGKPFCVPGETLHREAHAIPSPLKAETAHTHLGWGASGPANGIFHPASARWDGVIPLITPMRLPQPDDLRTILRLHPPTSNKQVAI